MTTPHLAAQLRHVLEAATLAPSVHNTQPWRFTPRPDGFDLHADPSRRLAVLDPAGRQLHLSCGAALRTACVAARALGLDADVDLLPEPADPTLLARVRLSSGAPADDRELALALAVLKRHTARGAFEERPLPGGLLRTLCDAADRAGAMLRHVRDGDELLELTVLLAGADADEERDPDYREELAGWVRADDSARDGVPARALADVAGRGTSLRLRDFRLEAPERGSGRAPRAEHPQVVVLTSREDGPRGWLVAGQALADVLLLAADQGVQAQPLGQVTDLPGPRQRLGAVLGLVGTPQLALRLGFPATEPVATPRRSLQDVLR